MRPRKWLAEPAVHFVLIGTLFFAGSLWLPPRQEADVREPITLSSARVEELRESFRRRTGADPTPAQQEALIAEAVDEEVLYREAVARGLDRHDRGVRARLVQKMRFLDGDPKRASDELYREALALGLDREDVVVRRILVEKMRLVLRAGEETPGEPELMAYLERHRERFTPGARVSFAHVFLSADRRGKRVEDDARRLLAALRDGSEPDGELGDPFPLGHRVVARARREIESLFGASFAAAVPELEPGSWSAPIRSAYGLHLVRVEARTPAATPPLSAVRNQVLHAVLAERREQRLERRLARLRKLYPVHVETVDEAGGKRS